MTGLGLGLAALIWDVPIKDVLAYGFFGLLIIIDSVIYRLVSLFFELFYVLAEAQLLESYVYQAIADRVYLFIGIVALFALSVSLLKALVNPDEINKGVIKSFKSLITSVILVILIPTIFNYAFSLQGAIIGDDLIGKIFQIDLNEYKEKNDSKITIADDSMYQMCEVDLNSDTPIDLEVKTKSMALDNLSIAITKNQCQANYITMTVLEAFYTPYSYDVTNTLDTKWSEARRYMIYTGDFDYIATYAKQIYDEKEGGEVYYTPIASTVAGIFLVYLLLSFCIDLGVRVAKLAFYQLIAPIPILFKMIPGKEGQFDKWLKATLSTFVEVFVRVLIISFVIFIASNLFDILSSMNDSLGRIGLLAKAIIVIGLFTFAKQAPKLLGEAIGFEGGNIKLGIKGKLTETPVIGKAFGAGYNAANKVKGAATGALGGGWSGRVNGIGFKNGAAIGAAKGFKSGGSQFNRQRQGVYEAFGGKGTAGLLGGRAYIDDKLDKMEKDSKKRFKEEFKNSQEYRNRYNQEIANQENNKRQAIQTAEQAYTNALNTREFINKSIDEFKKTDLYKGWREGANAQMQVNKMIADGSINAKDSHAIANAIDKIETNYANEMAKKYVESGQDSDGKVMQYISNLDKVAQAQNDLISAQGSLDAARSMAISSEAAEKAVNEFYRTAEGKELSYLGKAYKDEVQSDYLKNYRENNAEQIELYAEAMKKMAKDDKSSSKSSGSTSGSDKK